MHLQGPANKDYADVLMPQLYETAHIQAVISDPDVQPRDHTRLALFCLQMYHIERAYTQKGSYTKNKDKGFALLLYRYIVNS